MSKKGTKKQEKAFSRLGGGGGGQTRKGRQEGQKKEYSFLNSTLVIIITI